MFEKEAEEWVKKEFPLLEFEHIDLEESVTEYRAYKDGAEFGYNKAKGELEEKYKETICNLEMNLNSVTERLEELNKANEWYYVKDGKYPAHSNRVLVLTDEGVGFGIYGLDNQKWYTYDTGFDVIAWKEIELPKEIR